MAANSNEVEQVVARTLRDSLAKLQQTTSELDQAVNDLVSACASARPSNSLPSMLRARSAAASLAASLEVLSKFVVTALQLASPAETELLADLPRAAAPVPQRQASEPEPAVRLAAVEPLRVEPAAVEPATVEAAPVAESGLRETPASAATSELVAAEPQAAESVSATSVAEKVETPESIAPVLPAAEPLPAAPSGPAEFIVESNSAVPEPPTLDVPPLEPAFEPTAFEEPVAERVEAELVTDDAAIAEAVPQTAELYELATWKEPPSTPSLEAPSIEAATVEAASLEAPAVEATVPAETLRIDEAEPATVLAAVSIDAPTPLAASTLSEELPPEAKGFDVLALSPDQQELHRRANRVAKVSMQDVKMLRPREVALGKEHKDICIRLRDDIEKAHKEYDRRFHNILDHPVDYFYDWMVEILGDGDPKTLGDYPYPSPVLRR